MFYLLNTVNTDSHRATGGYRIILMSCFPEKPVSQPLFWSYVLLHPAVPGPLTLSSRRKVYRVLQISYRIVPLFCGIFLHIL